jgi:hypothetical protein
MLHGIPRMKEKPNKISKLPESKTDMKEKKDQEEGKTARKLSKEICASS